MREITAENAAAYLRDTGRVADGRAVAVCELAGGVSNVVLRVDLGGEPPFVLKQSRGRLRTEAEWLSRIDRIWNERAGLELVASVVPAGSVPAVLFEDPQNYLFAMSCAPDDSVVWKSQLMSGQIDPDTARRAGTLLGTIHSATAGHPALAGRLSDVEVFDQLRIDPYYRRVAQVHPDLAGALGRLIESLAGAPMPRPLVHGDFSPKNLLVHAGGLTLVDFEVAHAGDPAFDLGFFLSHLVLKAFRAGASAEPLLELTRVFWRSYDARADVDRDRVRRAIQHTAACVLARIDGKSPVDYRAALDHDAVRSFARRALLDQPLEWEEMVRMVVQ
jgi:5-methylthioribose kinase